jgi:hypothetical protein
LASCPVRATGIAISNDERNVINYLANLMMDADDNKASDYHISLDVNISFKRTSAADAAAVIISNDPNALAVTISEEDNRSAPQGGRHLIKLQQRHVRGEVILARTAPDCAANSRRKIPPCRGSSLRVSEQTRITT